MITCVYAVRPCIFNGPPVRTRTRQCSQPWTAYVAGNGSFFRVPKKVTVSNKFTVSITGNRPFVRVDAWHKACIYVAHGQRDGGAETKKVEHERNAKENIGPF